MAGMNRVDAVVGQWVLAGEPVGALGGQSGETRLYLELRQAGQPVDPDPWLMASDDKAKG
jgi:septal ring factor EnvC (AmiA/AmiB activator)